ncbi:MAG TPA: zf-HC2 domain-containing protein [Candidatus Acidoferrum sp.]|nr:zf-HC2 domain-containing protein [Candidatus Acidoferrum sp.]
MTCHLAIRLICDYIEGRLSPLAEEQVSKHLASCPDCMKILDAAEETLEVYFGADRSHLPHPTHV